MKAGGVGGWEQLRLQREWCIDDTSYLDAADAVHCLITVIFEKQH